MPAAPRWLNVVFARAFGPVPLPDVIRSAITVPLFVAVCYSIIHSGKSTFTRRCSSPGRRAADMSR